MRVFIERENRNEQLKFSGSVAALLKRLNLSPEEVIVARHNVLVTENDSLSDSDEVRILSVISGG